MSEQMITLTYGHYTIEVTQKSKTVLLVRALDKEGKAVSIDTTDAFVPSNVAISIEEAVDSIMKHQAQAEAEAK